MLPTKIKYLKVRYQFHTSRVPGLGQINPLITIPMPEYTIKL
jgi:hypothetical protein